MDFNMDIKWMYPNSISIFFLYPNPDSYSTKPWNIRYYPYLRRKKYSMKPLKFYLLRTRILVIYGRTVALRFDLHDHLRGVDCNPCPKRGHYNVEVGFGQTTG